MKMKLAAACYIVSAIAMLAIGLAFIFAQEFFPFHSDVIQTSWQELGKPEQTLYIGMMRTEGAGFLASAVAIAILLLIPFRRREVWSFWAMTVVGLVEHVPTLVATYHVSQTTAANPPWPITLALMVLLLIGLLLALSANREKQHGL